MKNFLNVIAFIFGNVGFLGMCLAACCMDSPDLKIPMIVLTISFIFFVIAGLLYSLIEKLY